MTDLNDLLIFVKVAESGSFVGASRALNMPTATVSRRIANLEDRLGLRLINRTTRSVGLTVEGERLFGRAAPVMREAAAIEHALHDLSEVPRGPLRISATPLFTRAYLVPVASKFLQLYPDVELDLVGTAARANLIEEGFDLAVRAGPLQDSTLIARRLVLGAPVTCASPDYIARMGEPRTPADLVDHECIVFSKPGHSSAWSYGSEKHTSSLAVSGRLKVNSYEAACHAAVLGMGVARLPAFVAEPEVRAGRLRLLLEGEGHDPLVLHAVYPSHRQNSMKIRKFIDLLVAHLECPESALLPISM